MKLLYKTLFLLCFIATTSLARGQVKPLLEREVSITFTNEKLDAALAKLSRQEKFTFSYNPAILNLNAVVDGTYQRKTLREILIYLVGTYIQLKEKGNYIILTKGNAAPTAKTGAIAPLTISGYVLNVDTGEKIGEVSVYDKKSLAAVVTNLYGFFKLTIDKPEAQNFISINKRNFRDTIITISPGAATFLNIALMPEQRLVAAAMNESDLKEDSVDVAILPPLLMDDQNKIQPKLERELNMENIKDTLYRPWQVSVFPFLGTNHALSGNIINDYSFNIVGGYALGVKKLELAGYFNINRGDVQHAQLAGSFNLNMGSMKGFQGAGSFNLNRGEAEAVQAAGVFNYNSETSQGVQLAGGMNIQQKDYNGIQVAGLMNVAGRTLEGVQVGVINYARNVQGSQIGIINISDSARGVPIGLMSIVKHGYHKIEVSADEVFYTNLSFRSGVHSFYTIFSAGIKPDNFEDPYWTFGYGVGTAPKLAKWLYLNFDLTANQVSKGNFTPAVNIVNKLYMGFEFQPLPKFALTAGVTLNAYVTDTTYDGYTDLFTTYQPKIIYDNTFSDNMNVKMWWGAKVGLRFL